MCLFKTNIFTDKRDLDNKNFKMFPNKIILLLYLKKQNTSLKIRTDFLYQHIDIKSFVHLKIS